MNFVNLLDRIICVELENHETREINPAPAKVLNQAGMISSYVETVEGINFYKHSAKLPPSVEGTVYIVEREVCALFPERTDLVFPARSWTYPEDETRDAVLYCLGFGRF